MAEAYLSTEEIGRFYKMKLLPREGRQVVFDTPKILMKMEVGSSECTMNGTRFIFETPVVESDAVAFVSRTDLSRVLDPVLRPSDDQARIGISKTVILDPAHGGGLEDRGTDRRIRVGGRVFAQACQTAPRSNSNRAGIQGGADP